MQRSLRPINLASLARIPSSLPAYGAQWPCCDSLPSLHCQTHRDHDAEVSREDVAPAGRRRVRHRADVKEGLRRRRRVPRHVAHEALQR